MEGKQLMGLVIILVAMTAQTLILGSVMVNSLEKPIIHTVIKEVVVTPTPIVSGTITPTQKKSTSSGIKK